MIKYDCEQCGKHLFDSDKSGGAAGAEAQNLGFVFKMPFLYGIDGCHFFCCKECWNRWLSDRTTSEQRDAGNKAVGEIKQRMVADKPKLIEGLQRIQRAVERKRKGVFGLSSSIGKK